MESVICQHHAGLYEVLIELAHFARLLLARHDAGLRLFGGLDDDHQPHGNGSPSLAVVGMLECFEIRFRHLHDGRHNPFGLFRIIIAQHRFPIGRDELP